MKDFGIVSIITPSYNSSSFIGETIEAIQAQTYQNWELLITDDCSNDNSVEIIKSYAEKDPRIKLFVMEKNVGAGAARNNSLAHASGRYIAFNDSDDRWLPRKLELQLQLMEEKMCAAVYGSYFTCSNEGDVKGIVLARTKETAFSIKCDDKMGNLTFMYDADKVGKHFMPVIRKRQDWAHKMALMEIAKVAYGVKEPVAIYRHTDNSISRNKKRLVVYNVAAYKTLGWPSTRSWLFFLFLFMPSYLLKQFNKKRNNDKYKDYLYLLDK